MNLVIKTVWDRKNQFYELKRTSLVLFLFVLVYVWIFMNRFDAHKNRNQIFEELISVFYFIKG